MQLTLYRHHSLTENFKQLAAISLPFHELIIVLQGKCHYRVNQEDITLESRDVLYAPKGAIRARQATKETVDYISIHFLCDENIDLPTKTPDCIRGCIPSLIVSADNIQSEFFPNAEPIIEPILHCIVKYIQTNLSKQKESALLRDLRHFMLKNVHRKLRVEDFAKQALLSVSYCNALFKKETGLPIMSYFTQMRMHEAKIQLISNLYTLQQIAENVGYSDYNLFSRTFKRHFGLTPTQYLAKYSP